MENQILIFLCSFLLFASVIPSYGNEKSESDVGKIVATPDFSNVEIVEIRLEHVQGPHKPEIVTVKYKPGKSTAKIIYSGLKVAAVDREAREDFQDYLNNPDPNAEKPKSAERLGKAPKWYWSTKPGDKTISKEEFKSIVSLIKDCKTWRKSDSGRYSWKIKTYDDDAPWFKKEKTIKKSPDSEGEIIERILKLYGDEGILEGRVWD